jgi:hypothetical protein
LRQQLPTCFGRTRYIPPTFANHFPRTRYIRLTFANHFPRTLYICSHLPKAIFEKNVTRLDTFARVIRHFGKFGASGHCLNKTQIDVPPCASTVCYEVIFIRTNQTVKVSEYVGLVNWTRSLSSTLQTLFILKMHHIKHASFWTCVSLNSLFLDKIFQFGFQLHQSQTQTKQISQFLVSTFPVPSDVNADVKVSSFFKSFLMLYLIGFI